MGLRLDRRTGYSASLRTRALGAGVLATLFVSPAWAQHADAGVEHPAARPAAPTEPKPPTATSGALPKMLDPSVLSERTRASLQERAAGRHAASLPNERAEPLRRGQAHMRRVQAVETDEGITLLSNRIHRLPEPRLSALVAQTPRARTEPPSREEAATTSEPPHLTETRSLRPGSRSTSTGTGLGWLLWPFVLFITTGAALGTLWFRKKVQ